MAKSNNEIPTTQRAYTVLLRGADPGDKSWRDALWATHEAVNKGAKVFGDWLLTLRGGLCHTLADEGNSQGRRNRRILLALSWLSVESRNGAPEGLVIESPVEALQEILRLRQLPPAQIEEWIVDCTSSLSAEIRPDAVWVNRSKSFDQVAADCPSLNRQEIWDLLEPFFANPNVYLAPEESITDDAEGRASQSAEKAKDLVQKAGGWLSNRFGAGKGADFARLAQAYDEISDWAQQASGNIVASESLSSLATSLTAFSPDSQDVNGVLSVISGPGYKSATRNHIQSIATQAEVTRKTWTDLSN